MRVGQPPRVVHPKVSEAMNVVDFVGYAPNPHWQRNQTYAQALQTTHSLRNLRQSTKVGGGQLAAQWGAALTWQSGGA